MSDSITRLLQKQRDINAEMSVLIRNSNKIQSTICDLEKTLQKVNTEIARQQNERHNRLSTQMRRIESQTCQNPRNPTTAQSTPKYQTQMTQNDIPWNLQGMQNMPVEGPENMEHSYIFPVHKETNVNPTPYMNQFRVDSDGNSYMYPYNAPTSQSRGVGV